MFTVKHISIDGSENLVEAEEVKYDPGASSQGSVGPSGGEYSAGRPRALYLDGIPYGGGTFFVMNASGKTVARYDLGASPVPHLGTHEEPKSWREPGHPPAHVHGEARVAGDDYTARVA